MSDDTTSVVQADVVPVAAGHVFDLPMQVFSQGLERRGANRIALMKWVRSSLVENVDYGKIHVVNKHNCPDGKRCTNPAHFSKDTLFKPGSEKILGMLGLIPAFPGLADYEARAVRGDEIKSIILRCVIVDASGRPVGEGAGARSVDKDNGDLNKTLKMAEKSAVIDACLRTAGLSEVFTQDLDDMIEPNSQPQEDTPSCTLPAAKAVGRPVPAPPVAAGPAKAEAEPDLDFARKSCHAYGAEWGFDHDAIYAVALRIRPEITSTKALDLAGWREVYKAIRSCCQIERKEMFGSLRPLTDEERLAFREQMKFKNQPAMEADSDTESADAIPPDLSVVPDSNAWFIGRSKAISSKVFPQPPAFQDWLAKQFAGREWLGDWQFAPLDDLRAIHEGLCGLAVKSKIPVKP